MSTQSVSSRANAAPRADGAPPPSGVRIWLMAARVRTLPASIAPVLVGTSLAGWAGTFGRDSFGWVAPPVLNRFTRLAIEMCPADGTLRVVGYECEPGADPSQRATQVTSVSAPVLEPTALS